MKINAVQNTTQQSVIVIFNGNESKQSLLMKDASKYQLHPVQRQGVDIKLRKAKSSLKGLTVPALSTAIFVKIK